MAGDAEAPASLEQLAAAGPALRAVEVVERLGLWDRPPPGAPASRPLVLLNMVCTVDGRASLAGRSGGLSSPADRELFHALRAAVDAVLVGAGTARAERYGPLVREPAARERRRLHGLAEEPLACIVTRTLALGEDLPLLRAPGARVALLTPSEAELPPTAAEVRYVRARDTSGALDLGHALRELRERAGVQVVLCEGGPSLAGALLRESLLDQLFLTVAPLLAAGGDDDLRIVRGPELDPPAALELRDVMRAASGLFLHYGVVGSERISRATTSSSSLAS